MPISEYYVQVPLTRSFAKLFFFYPEGGNVEKIADERGTPHDHVTARYEVEKGFPLGRGKFDPPIGKDKNRDHAYILDTLLKASKNPNALYVFVADKLREPDASGKMVTYHRVREGELNLFEMSLRDRVIFLLALSSMLHLQHLCLQITFYGLLRLADLHEKLR